MINPLRLEIPSEIITERLLLRTPRIGDGALIIDATLASLPELKAWMPWASDQYTINDSEDWCRRSASKFLARDEAGYLILNRQTGRYLGNIASVSRNWSVPKFEIGYWLASCETGHGYMTEVVRAVTQMTFEDFGARRIEIHTDAENHRSRRVAERAGYVLEGILKNCSRGRDAQLRDDCMYAMTR